MEKSLVKSSNEISLITESGHILAEALTSLKKEIKTDVSFKELDEYFFELVKKLGGEPAFLGYKPEGADRPYPASICASVNNMVVHGVPTGYKIKESDLVKIDAGVKFKGYCSDSAITVPMSKASDEANKLALVTEEALNKAISVAFEGNTLGDIGYIVSETVRSNGFKIIKSLTGHGIGKKLHEDPSVYNYGTPKTGLRLKSGMVLAIEPITAISTESIRQLVDESYATVNGSLSAHFEHTILITKNEAVILTK